jgi:hypothetical protein
MAAKGKPIERSPRGGKKHQPGRGHDRKSSEAKKKRFAQGGGKVPTTGRERQQGVESVGQAT